MSTRQPQEIDWDRIDKTKFFFVGIGAFSGVTTLLYPLSVIKTNLQAAHGGQTTAQTTAMIWRTRGLPGFYRGYATVVFGTIPARMVYLSSLEMTKSAVNKTGQHLGVDPTVLAGSSNFVAGAISSLITQVITVPMDVISQRQMVHSSGGAPGPAAAAASGASAPAPAPAGAATAPGVVQAPGATSSSVPSSSSSSSSSATRGGTAGGQGHARMHTSALDATMHRSLGAGRQRQQLQAAEVPSCRAVDAGRQATHGLATAASSAPSYNYQNSATAGASSQRSLRCAQSPPGHGSCSRTIATSARLAGSGADAAASGPSGGSALHIVRVILKEEGVLGLYRGFGASIITYVPSSAVWWGCYGLYQKLAWNMLGAGPLLPASQESRTSSGAPPAADGGALALRSSSPSSSGSEAGGGGGGGGGAAVGAGAAPSTMDVVLVQTSASCLAGMTSAGITSPLDLIKTRIQVAQRQQGQAVTFRAVFAEVLREDGWLGFFRAAGPRMANSALWGTAMMSVYEALKRLSVKD